MKFARRLLLALLPGTVAGCLTVGSSDGPVGTQGKIIGANDLVPVAADGGNVPDRYRPLIDAFGKISMGCTATHIGDGIVLTAGHCFDAPSTRTDHLDCTGVTVAWGVRTGRAPYLSSRCLDVLAAERSGDRDYAIFKVTPVPPVAVSVDLSPRPAANTALTIFSHPQMRPLEWSQTCTLQPGASSGAGASQFSHQCDTEPGSSGATVLSDATLRVVGIHDGGLAPWNYATYLADTPLGEVIGGVPPAPPPGPGPTPPPSDAPVAGPGEVVISEIMYDPTGADADSEWFEVHNVASGPRRLTGLVIADASGTSRPIASEVVLAAGQYGVFARVRAGAVARAVPAASIVYEYGVDLRLLNGAGGGIALRDATGMKLSSVPYEGWFPTTITGSSIQRRASAVDPAADASQWCASAAPWAAGADRGTPGVASDCP